MANLPFVSVIMNCLNGERYLRQAIDSVLSQTYENWELIFWDNQSRDDSASIVSSYNDSRIRYYLAPKHTNLGEARNQALTKARGEWIGFLDVDDIWFSEKLRVNVEAANNSNTNLYLIYSRCELFSALSDSDDKSKIVGIYPKATKLPVSNLYNLLFYGNLVPFSSALYKKQILKEIGGIPPYGYSPDYFLAMRLSREGHVVAINKILCRYRVSDNSMSARLRSLGWQESADIIKYFAKLDGNDNKSKPMTAAYILFCLMKGSYFKSLALLKEIGIFGFLFGVSKFLLFRLRHF